MARSKRKRGGQPGHHKYQRPLVPAADCNERVSLELDACRRCGDRLDGDDPEPLRHQVWELPKIKPLITEYQRHRLHCSCCGASTCAPLPAGVPTGQSGPRLVAPIRRQVESRLLRGYGTGANGMCRELHEHRDRLWAFLDHEGVEPTNNAAERSLRHAVIWRKLSFGTQSTSGSRFVETLLTAIESCRQQGRDVFAWVTAAVQSRFAGQPCTSLLPGV